MIKQGVMVPEKGQKLDTPTRSLRLHGDPVRTADYTEANPSSLEKTKQEFQDECNIVEKLKRARRLRMAPDEHLARRQPMFGDFTGQHDYVSMRERIRKGDEAFMQLSPELRFKFENDAANLIGFLDDPANHAEAIELGLIPDPEAPPPPTLETRVADAVGKAVQKAMQSPSSDAPE